MGWHQHHAIVVTSWDDAAVEVAHAEAVRLFSERYGHGHAAAPVSPLSDYGVNGHRSFCVFPDGSKEGWAHSDNADECRAVFRAWLKGTHLKWVEVMFGNEYDQPSRIIEADETDYIEETT